MTVDALPIQRSLPLAQPCVPPRAPSIWAALGLIALYLILQAAFAGALLGAVTLIQRFTRAAPAANPSGQTVTGALQQAGTVAAVTIAGVCAAALLVLLLVHRRWPQLWRHATPPGLGVLRPTHPRWLLAAVLLGCMMPLLGGVLTQLLAHGRHISQDIETLTISAPLIWRIVLALMAVTLAPLLEELLFRGLLLSALIPRFGVRLGVLLSAAAFATIHLPGLEWQWYAVPALILLGIVLGWLRLHYQSLWPAVVAHGMHNALALSVWFFILAGSR